MISGVLKSLSWDWCSSTIFVGDMDSGTECTVSKFAEGIKHSSTVDMMEGMPSQGTWTGLRIGPL